MNAFVDRLKSERDELKFKLDKLYNFINSNDFANINKIQQSLLIVQHGAMCAYYSCLDERLKDIEYTTVN